MRGHGFRAGVVTAALVAVTALAACGGSGDDAGAAGTPGTEAATGATPTTGDDPEDTDAGDADPEESDAGDATGHGGDEEGNGKSGKDDDRKGSDGGPDSGPDDGNEDAPSMGRIGEPVPDQAPAVEDRAFSTEEREYLDGRVPRGADPAPILQAGLEACQRLGYLSRHDPDGAVEALRDGEIANAEEAVPTLCPEHRDLLDRSRR